MTKLGILNQLQQELVKAAEQQHHKTLALARELIPELTAEDIRNPQDFPKLMNHPHFQFEDGMSAGLLAALSLIRRFIKDDAAR